MQQQQEQQQQPTLDQLVAYLRVQAVVPSAASALKQRQLNVSYTEKSSAWETSHWVQMVLQLSKQPFATSLGLVGYAVLVEHLVEQHAQVGKQLSGLQQQQQQHQQAGLHYDLLQRHQQEQQALLQQQRQLAADISMYKRGGQAVYDAEVKRRTASAAESRVRGSESYSNIRDSTMVFWYRFPPEQMDSFFQLFENTGWIRLVSTRGTADHTDMLPAEAASLARSAYDSMREEMATSAANPPDFSKFAKGLVPLVKTLAAADHAVATMLSLCMAAVEVTRNDRQSQQVVVAVGIVHRWLVGECGSYWVCVSAQSGIVAVVAWGGG